MSGKREYLLRFLRSYANNEPMGNSDDRLSEDRAHRRAEELLLDLLADAEVTAAWNDASELWWYA